MSENKKQENAKPENVINVPDLQEFTASAGGKQPAVERQIIAGWQSGKTTKQLFSEFQEQRKGTTKDASIERFRVYVGCARRRAVAQGITIK